MNDAILVINTGSSSIKFAVYQYLPDGTLGWCDYTGSVDNIGADTHFSVTTPKNSKNQSKSHYQASWAITDHAQATQQILSWLTRDADDIQLVAAGHRVVHGGTRYTHAVCIDAHVIDDLTALTGLAPLHQPHALRAIAALTEVYPHLPQVACFDTAFHAAMPWYEQQFALPHRYSENGIRRYGFHGLSYEYICQVLPNYAGAAANGKVVIAHLGYGVSMCAVQNSKSVATTMSFTPLDGLPMGTRSGALDPAVVLYLLQTGIGANDVSDLLHHQSGLLGLSGISGDMHVLLQNSEQDAVKAVEYFCYRVNRELGSLAAALGGLDVLVFTGGIGEHAVAVRQRICQAAAWLGVDIDVDANQANAMQISSNLSKVAVWVIPANEQLLIAQHTANIFSNS